MAAVVYGLCALTAMLCTYLLLRAYMQQRYKLLLWSGVCFAVLALNNFLLIIDKLLMPLVDLSVTRNVVSLVAVLILLYGLIWDAE